MKKRAMNGEPIEKADPPETVRLIPRECGENPDGPSPDTAGPGDEIVGIARKIEDARGRMEALASEMRTLESLTERAMGERDRGAGVPRLNEGIELRLLAAPISAREREVLALLLEGKSNREIALGLGISVKTVKDHLWKAYRVIGVKSRTQLFHWLISP